MLTVLIVDDEENARHGLTKLLTADGFQVLAAADGQEALDCLQQQSVDLVISDINMPGMNGLTFLGILSQSHPHMKVIMITAYGGVESYLEAINLGAIEYLNKPFRLDELKAIINKIFHRPDNPWHGPATAS
jgi:DNA-binding NtrC family response regulator